MLSRTPVQSRQLLKIEPADSLGFSGEAELSPLQTPTEYNPVPLSFVNISPNNCLQNPQVKLKRSRKSMRKSQLKQFLC